MENGAEECNAIVNMAELAHARSIRGVSACSDPRLVYKTNLMMISGAVLENYSTPPGKIPAAGRNVQQYIVRKDVILCQSLVEFSTGHIWPSG